MNTETTQLIKTSTPATGEWKDAGGVISSPNAYLTDGATAAVVAIEASHDGVGVTLVGTITLSAGTPSDTLSVPSTVNFSLVRARVISVTGGGVTAVAATLDQ